jgi:hypothetical protein
LAKSKLHENPNGHKPKYSNFAQLAQGVSQVADATLSQGERLFLNCLAVHSVKENPRPGNARLMRACGVTSRQGLNYIARLLIEKGLIEVVAYGKGGHGMATVYRICTEDDRFPKREPTSSDLQVSDSQPTSPDLQVTSEQPASERALTRKYDPTYPQVNPNLPASSDLHPDLDSEYKNEYNSESAADAASSYEDELTLDGLRKLRTRRQQQDSKGILLPDGYKWWERQSRNDYPDLWVMLDKENPNATQLRPVRESQTATPTETATPIPEQEHVCPDCNGRLYDFLTHRCPAQNRRQGVR